MFLGLWVTAGCAPLYTGMDACSYSDSCIGAKTEGTEPSMHLVGHDMTKRDACGAVVNEIVRYTNDEIAKREVDNGAVVIEIVRYTNDEIAKREVENGAVVNEIVRYTNDKIVKRDADGIAI